MPRVQSPPIVRDLVRSIERRSERLDLSEALASLRQGLGVHALVFLHLVEDLDGWRIDAFCASNVADPTRLRRALARHLESLPALPRWLVPSSHRTRRNAPILLEGDARDEYLADPLHQAAFGPAGLEDHQLLAVHLCESDTSLGWLGCFDPHAITRETTRGVQLLAPALARRLHDERALVESERHRAALAATLDELGAPALVVDNHGRIHECNSMARELLVTRRRDVATSLQALLARRTPALPFALVRVPTHRTEHHLAVLRPRTPEARMDLAVSIAAARWRLTKRQHQVLGLLMRGESNHDIACALAITTRTTEMHVSALFERALVENRAGLVAAVLLG